MLKSFVFTVLLVQFKGIASLTKTWKHNVNADNPENYEIGKDCRGFQFPKRYENVCMMSLGQIETNEIFLPIDGEVVFRENASIVFKEQSKSCIKVKQPKYWNWANPWAWSSILSDNKAVPHQEHVPSICDEVVFPSDALYSVDLGEAVTLVKIITMRGVRIYDLNNAMYDGCPEFLGSLLYAPKVTDDDLNLYCDTFEFLTVDLSQVCATFQPEPIKCSEPVPLFGHCQYFCGGVIIVPEAKDDKHKRIPLENFMEENNNIDYYYMTPYQKDAQIIFTDKHEYTGDSIIYTKNVYEALKSYFSAHNITNAKLLTSGMPLVGDKVARNAIGVIFGTLVFVVSIFAVLYAIYEGPFRHYTFSSRFNLSRYNQALRRSVIFSRFDNREGGVSIAGSVMSLQRAFDNPMFGQPVPSTSYDNPRDTVDDAQEMHEENCGQLPEQDTEFKNPMYDDNTVETISDDITIENLTLSEQD